MAKQYPHNRKTTQNNPQTTLNNGKQRQTIKNNGKQRSNNEKQRHNLTRTGFEGVFKGVCEPKNSVKGIFHSPQPCSIGGQHHGQRHAGPESSTVNP
jgi:hypothetical protein